MINPEYLRSPTNKIIYVGAFIQAEDLKALKTYELLQKNVYAFFCLKELHAFLSFIQIIKKIIIHFQSEHIFLITTWLSIITITSFTANMFTQTFMMIEYRHNALNSNGFKSVWKLRLLKPHYPQKLFTPWLSVFLIYDVRFISWWLN